MERAKIEAALGELEDLLANGVEDEHAYQDWLERHPVVLLVFGYQRAVPKPNVRSKGALYIPDFLVQQPNGAWRILELKTPQAEVLHDRDRRNTFYATFAQYVSQCQDYSEAFDEPAAVAGVESKYGIKVQRRPQSTIIAGRNEGIEFQKLYELTNRTTPPVEVCTFDDLRGALERHRTFYCGSYDQARGLSFYAMLSLHQPDQRFVNNHLFDIGIRRDRDRAAIFINPEGYLRLTVWDSTGRRHDARARTPLSPEDFDTPHWFQFEVGAGDGFGFLAIQLDGSYQIDIKTNDFPFVLTNAYVLGSDWDGHAHSLFSANELGVFDRPMAFEDKAKLRRHATERMEQIATGEADKWVVFRGHKYMQTANHPLAAKSSSNPT